MPMRAATLIRSVDSDLTLLADLTEVLGALFPRAVEAAEALGGSTSDNVFVRTSGISDPTASAALDGRRRHRQQHVDRSRREVAHAVKSLRRAIVHAGLAEGR